MSILSCRSPAEECIHVCKRELASDYVWSYSRHLGATAAAKAHRRADSPVGHQPRERRGRFPSVEHRATSDEGSRPALCSMHTQGERVDAKVGRSALSVFKILNLGFVPLNGLEGRSKIERVLSVSTPSISRLGFCAFIRHLSHEYLSQGIMVLVKKQGCGSSGRPKRYLFVSFGHCGLLITPSCNLCKVSCFVGFVCQVLDRSREASVTPSYSCGLQD